MPTPKTRAGVPRRSVTDRCRTNGTGCVRFGDRLSCFARPLDDSHDHRLSRVRQRVKRSDVAAVVEVFRTLSGRVGPVRANQEVPRQILRQTWSALNVPLMWAASSGDEECPVLLWLACWRTNGIVSVCDVTWTDVKQCSLGGAVWREQ